jgi:SulP family sulfate permease
VFAMDATGLHALEDVHHRFTKQGTIVLISGIRDQPLMVLRRSGALERFGAGKVLGSFREASVRAWAVLEEEPEGGAGTTSL